MLSRREFTVAAAGLLSASSASAAAASDLRPKLSDVSFSSRFGYHPKIDVFDLAKAFHATRIDWSYGSPEFIAEARRRGYPLTAAISPLLDFNAADPSDRVRDTHGALLKAPWQPWPNAYWGCFNSPTFRHKAIGRMKALIAAGASGIQIDDYRGNLDVARFGGCWCENCRLKATAHRVDLDKAMLSFQKKSILEFYEFIKPRTAGILKSCNNFGARWDTAAGAFDFGMSEFDPTPLKTTFEGMLKNELEGRRQLITFRSEDVLATRTAIAQTYALGGLIIVPWDVYLRSTPEGSERYYGAPSDYADLYKGVRTHASWFDDFRLLAARGAQFAHRPDVLECEAARDLVVLRQGPARNLTLHVVSLARPAAKLVRIRTDRRTASLATPASSIVLASHWKAGWLSFEAPPGTPWTMIHIS